MFIMPSSTVTLYAGVPVDHNHNIAFQSYDQLVSKMQKYVIPGGQFVDVTYCREGEPIKVEAAIATVMKCNMISFKNPAYENRVIWGIITDRRYINNETTEISYAVEAWLSFGLDVTPDICRIEREHLSEAGYANEQLNPYTSTVGELMTDEPALRTNHYSMLPPAAADTVLSKDVEMVIALFMSPFDYEGLDGWTDFKQFWDKGIILGSDKTFLGYPFDQFAFLMSWDYAQISHNYSYSYHPYSWGPFADQVVVKQGYFKPLDSALDWIAGQGLTGNILGFYYMPNWLEFTEAPASSLPTDERTVSIDTPEIEEFGKLNRWPFDYIEAIAPDGTSKEFIWEDFLPVANGTAKKANFRIMVPLDNTATVHLLPYQYQQRFGGSGSSENWPENLNQQERLEYSSIPQMPLATDSYLTYLSTQYQATLQTNNAQSRHKQRQLASDAAGMVTSGLDTGKIADNAQTLGSFASGAASGGVSSGLAAAGGAGAVAGAAVGLGMAAYRGVGNIKDAYGLYTEGKRAYGSAQNYRNYSPMQFSQTADGTRDNSGYAYSRQAFISDIYEPGTTGGRLPYFINGVCFRLVRRRLRSELKKSFEEYLRRYGYKSVRIGTPRIFGYCQNSQSQDEIPHWYVINGKKGTYVQTAGFAVYGQAQPICDSIASMFESGVLFLKGDEL